MKEKAHLGPDTKSFSLDYGNITELIVVDQSVTSIDSPDRECEASDRDTTNLDPSGSVVPH